MDPLSQAALGAVVPQSVSAKKELRLITLIGALAGMLADLDIFIRSDSDPLLWLEYHRHFTHSLVFIPVGGLAGTLLAWPLFRKKLSFKKAYLFATLGYATHGLLDACTSYGTHLLWPFSNKRFAWDIISIIDPVFTITLSALILLAYLFKNPRFARWGVIFIFTYMSLGLLQRERAEAVLHDIAAKRGHETIARVTVKPTLGNLFLWRGIYVANGNYYMDGIRVGLVGPPRVYPGESIKQVTTEMLKKFVPTDSRQYRDILRFAHFSDQYLAWHPEHSFVLGDLRYSYLPNKVRPLWGIYIYPELPNHHVIYDNFREPPERVWATFWDMLLGI